MKLSLAFWGTVLILVSHILYFVVGNQAIDISYSWQLAPPENIARNPWLAIWYMHGNPPGLSLLYYFVQKPIPVWLFTGAMMGLHVLAYRLFTAASEKLFPARAISILALALFVNPMVVAYFQYPFYSTYLFVVFCAGLYALTRQTTAGYTWMCGSLLLTGILRSTLAFPVGWVLAAPLVWRIKKAKHLLIVLLCSLPALVWSYKNYHLFGVFAPSSWQGINLAHGGHVDLSKGKYPAINSPFAYEKVPFALQDSALELRYRQVPYLHGYHLNNLKTIYLSRYLSQEVKHQLNLTRSLKVAALGLFQYLESPLRYDLLYANSYATKTGIRNHTYPFDPLDLPNYERPVKGGTFVLPLSMYTLLYPIVFVLALGLALRKRDKDLGLILWMVLVVSAIYCVVDPSEANRMRMEIEPLWWWLLLAVVYHTFWGKKQKTMEVPFA